MKNNSNNSKNSKLKLFYQKAKRFFFVTILSNSKLFFIYVFKKNSIFLKGLIATTKKRQKNYRLNKANVSLNKAPTTFLDNHNNKDNKIIQLSDVLSMSNLSLKRIKSSKSWLDILLTTKIELPKSSNSFLNQSIFFKNRHKIFFAFSASFLLISTIVTPVVLLQQQNKNNNKMVIFQNITNLLNDSKTKKELTINNSNFSSEDFVAIFSLALKEKILTKTNNNSLVAYINKDFQLKLPDLESRITTDGQLFNFELEYGEVKSTFKNWRLKRNSNDKDVIAKELRKVKKEFDDMDYKIIHMNNFYVDDQILDYEKEITEKLLAKLKVKPKNITIFLDDNPILKEAKKPIPVKFLITNDQIVENWEIENWFIYFDKMIDSKKEFNSIEAQIRNSENKTIDIISEDENLIVDNIKNEIIEKFKSRFQINSPHLEITISPNKSKISKLGVSFEFIIFNKKISQNATMIDWKIVLKNSLKRQNEINFANTIKKINDVKKKVINVGIQNSNSSINDVKEILKSEFEKMFASSQIKGYILSVFNNSNLVSEYGTNFDFSIQLIQDNTKTHTFKDWKAMREKPPKEKIQILISSVENFFNQTNYWEGMINIGKKESNKNVSIWDKKNDIEEKLLRYLDYFKPYKKQKDIYKIQIILNKNKDIISDQGKSFVFRVKINDVFSNPINSWKVKKDLSDEEKIVIDFFKKINDFSQKVVLLSNDNDSKDNTITNNKSKIKFAINDMFKKANIVFPKELDIEIEDSFNPISTHEFGTSFVFNLKGYGYEFRITNWMVKKELTPFEKIKEKLDTIQKTFKNYNDKIIKLGNVLEKRINVYKNEIEDKLMKIAPKIRDNLPSLRIEILPNDHKVSSSGLGTSFQFKLIVGNYSKIINSSWTVKRDNVPLEQNQLDIQKAFNFLNNYDNKLIQLESPDKNLKTIEDYEDMIKLKIKSILQNNNFDPKIEIKIIKTKINISNNDSIDNQLKICYKPIDFEFIIFKKDFNFQIKVQKWQISRIWTLYEKKINFLEHWIKNESFKIKLKRDKNTISANKNIIVNKIKADFTQTSIYKKYFKKDYNENFISIFIIDSYKTLVEKPQINLILIYNSEYGWKKEVTTTLVIDWEI